MSTTREIPARAYNIAKAGVRIRELRNNRGLTQERLSDKLHLTSKTISSIERGVTGCSVDVFVDMANFFHVSLDYLITGSDLDEDPVCVLNHIIRFLSAYRDSISATEPQNTND